MTRRTSLFLAAALALVVAGCGSDSAGPALADRTATTVPAQAIPATPSTTAPAPGPEPAPASDGPGEPGGGPAFLQSALAGSTAASSGRMEGSFEVIGMDGAPSGSSFAMEFSAVFDYSVPAYGFVMDLSGLLDAAAAQGEPIPPEMASMFSEMELRSIGDTAYVKFPFFTSMLGAETEWVSMPAEDGAGAAGDFSFGLDPSDPAGILGLFEGVDAQTEELGRETLRGAEVTHYRVRFDVASLAAQADAEARARLDELGPLPIDELPLDLWIGDDGLVHRFVMDFDGSSVQAVPGEGFERMLITFDMFDFGEPVVVEPPPADQVTDVADLEMGFFGFSG